MSTVALNRSATVEIFSTYSASAGRHVASDAVATATMHPAVLRIAAATYALMVATFWIGFVRSGMLAEAMVIVSVCLVAYAGLPWSMSVAASRFKARHGEVEPTPPSFRKFLAGHFETGAGNVSGFEAFVLVVTVPVCLLGAAIAFAIIYNTLA